MWKKRHNKGKQQAPIEQLKEESASVVSKASAKANKKRKKKKKQSRKEKNGSHQPSDQTHNAAPAETAQEKAQKGEGIKPSSEKQQPPEPPSAMASPVVAEGTIGALSAQQARKAEGCAQQAARAREGGGDARALAREVLNARAHEVTELKQAVDTVEVETVNDWLREALCSGDENSLRVTIKRAKDTAQQQGFSLKQVKLLKQSPTG